MPATISRAALCLAGLVCIAMWWVFQADTMMRLGLMHRSLTHEDIRVVRTVRLELAVARWAALLTGAVLIGCALFWQRLRSSRFVRGMSRRASVYPAAYRRYLARIFTPSLAAMALPYMAVALYIIMAESLLSSATIWFVNREDGLIETASAVLLLIASLLSLRIALRARPGSPRKWMHALLALVFFVMCGEEISWGQRILGFGTPEIVTAHNIQGEVNFHNLFGYFFDHLFMLAFFTWGVVVPVLYRVSPFWRGVFEAVRLPIPSAGLAVGMLAVSLMQYRWYYAVIPPLHSLRLAEMRELLSALAFLVLMLEVWKLARVGRGPAPDRPERAVPGN